MKLKDIFCFHKWKKFEEFELKGNTCVIYRCKKCGAVRSKLT